MNIDFDLRLRLAVFDRVEQLRRASRGVVTRHQLNEGIVFEGQAVPIWNQQKGIFRPRVLPEPSGPARAAYLKPGGAYADVSGLTKALIISLWNVVPDVTACLAGSSRRLRSCWVLAWAL